MALSVSGSKRATPTEEASYDDAQDDALISNILNGIEGEIPGDFNFGDTVGKADDAMDFEDISDDDLPDDEEATTGNAGAMDDVDAARDDMLDELIREGGEGTGLGGNDELDDLFGDMGPMSDSAVPAAGVLELDDIDFEEGAVPGARLNTQLDKSRISPIDDDDLLRSVDFDGDTDMDGELEEPALKPHEPTPQELVKQYFPDFEPNKILSFSSLFRPKPATLSIALPKPPKVLVPTKVSVEMAPDDQVFFNRPLTSAKGHINNNGKRVVVIPPPVEESDFDEDATNAEVDGFKLPESLEKDLFMACDDWESKLETMMATPPPTPPRQVGDEDDESWDLETRPAKRMKLMPRYLDQLPDSWPDDEAIVNGDLSFIASKTMLDLNDPHLLVDIRQPNEIRRTRRIGGEFKRSVNKDLIQRYNISNDEAYDLLKENHQNKVRSTIGQLTIEHSMPALRLQTPYYKTKLTTKEARSFHRPSINFHVDQVIRFSKIKTRKKKTYRGKDIQEVLNTTKDLSLSDNCNFILLEYSEEYPTVMSNFGMGSRLINYYRRKGPDDESRPKYDIGETHVLMSQDRSPFWNFGTVDPGETVPTLYNRMVRAPVFRQTPKSTDFLVIRNTHENQSHYYLRTIPNLYVVGQLFPVTDVPGPHSRKVTTAAKNRLKMVCYRVAKRKEGKAIAVKDISSHFPENNDMQNRQKMKEFMSYQKTSGLWEMKPGEPLPDETAIRGMIKPEDLCLLEAMQVGVRNLADAGYGKVVEDFDEDGKDNLSLEQQLTPWVSTKNFINATQGKAMLQLHGEGDPSGRGEAFSFVRTSMKGGFKAIGESLEEKMDKKRLKELGGHSYNVALQQRQYEEAIDRIWRAQHRSLGSTEELPDVEMEDAQRDDHVDNLFEEGRTPMSEAVTPGPWALNDEETTSQFSRFSATTQRNKVLKINRKVKNAQGQIETKVELIKDPKVIRQYLQRRREIEAEQIQLEDLAPTGNDELDSMYKKKLQIELARLERNKGRREARERQGGRKGMAGDAMSPQATTPGSPMAPTPPPVKQATTRKCANCGQAGHIRTNKKLCPKLNGTWPADAMSPPATAPTPSASA
ncbi:hypothetical protein RUND412_003514 [Rhizina undulata]